MGGNTFKTSGPGGAPLDVPRMGPELYAKMCVDLQSKLQTIFRRVTVPRAPPGKLDHGDVDILVSGALCAWDTEMLKGIIGATHVKENGRTTSFAVPHTTCTGYAQVDVEVAPGDGTPDNLGLFEWTEFMKSDGDLLQLVGICHRGLGLRNNDRGLHLIIEEIEPYNNKKSLLFLTDDPDQMMWFYGYDIEKYWDGFQSEEELFKWVTGSRFFDKTLFENRVETSNDRSRQKKRQMYNRFVDEFMPSLIATGDKEPKDDSHSWTRKKVLEAALEEFGKHDQHKAMIQEHELLTKNEEITGLVKELLPATNSRIVTMRALRRWVYFADGKPFMSSVANVKEGRLWSEALTDDVKIKDFLEWVGQNWQQVKALEQQRVKGTKSDTTTQASSTSPPSLVFDVKTPSTVPGTPTTSYRAAAERLVDCSDISNGENVLPNTPQASVALSPSVVLVAGTPETPNRSVTDRLVDDSDIDDKEDTAKSIARQASAPNVEAAQANTDQANPVTLANKTSHSTVLPSTTQLVGGPPATDSSPCPDEMV